MKTIYHIWIIFIITIACCSESYSIDGYTLKKVENRNVYVENIALEQYAELTEKALNLLANKLKEIDGFDMCAEAQECLKRVSFFMDWNTNPHGAAVYHPSREWLIANGWNPAKAKSVNITNIKNFLDWTALNQPYMILHELSHAYQDIVLGNDNKDVMQSFNQAIQAGKYQNVDYFNGQSVSEQKTKAYAATNLHEYFAEITEAFYGKNDYYPFDNKELNEYDLQGYKMLQKVWQNNTVKPIVSYFDNTVYYRLNTMFYGDKKSLDIINDSHRNDIRMAASGNFSGQYWKIEALENGYYRLTTMFQGEGKSLEVIENDGNMVIKLGKTQNQPGQYWKIEKTKDNYYRLTNMLKGEEKSLEAFDDINNQPIIRLGNSGNYSGQYWKIENEGR